MPLLLETNEFKKSPLLPAGEHILTLKSIAKVRVTSQFSKEEDGKVDKFIFRFNSNQQYTDEDTGETAPYEYAVFTNMKYGASNASLTKLLNQLVPDIDEENAKGFDLEELLNKKFTANIRHSKNPKTGNKYAELLFITPYFRRRPVPGTQENDTAVLDAAIKVKGKTPPVRVPAENDDETDLFENE